MKYAKRKRKIAPAATSVAKPAVVIAVAADSGAQSDARRLVGKAGRAMPTPADYTLSSHCTIQEGASLKSALLSLEDSPRPVLIDVHAVERIDTAALQLLCAFVRDRRSRGRRTEWTGRATTFIEAVELLGLSQALGYTAGASA